MEFVNYTILSIYCEKENTDFNFVLFRNLSTTKETKGMDCETLQC